MLTWSVPGGGKVRPADTARPAAGPDCSPSSMTCRWCRCNGRGTKEMSMQLEWTGVCHLFGRWCRCKERNQNRWDAGRLERVLSSLWAACGGVLFPMNPSSLRACAAPYAQPSGDRVCTAGACRAARRRGIPAVLARRGWPSAGPPFRRRPPSPSLLNHLLKGEEVSAE